MDLKFRVAARISKPVHEVFEAVADPKQLSAYFTTGGAQGRLETGATVTWDFHDYPGAFPVEVVEVVSDEKIVLKWAASEGEAPNLPEVDAKERGSDYQTLVTMTFSALDDGRTLVEIAEEGWRETEGALKASYGNCQGWSQMLCALKVWLEHGINLRQGMYK
ncbi:MAG: SRPBCC domain-containing protein [Sphingomonas sp.]|nr:SRPBCC domain-containing protein [Sphingomonas sp.]